MKNLLKTDEDNDQSYILEVDVKYPKRLYNLHCDLPFLTERIKTDKYNKLVRNLYDKNNYAVHIRSLKQVLDHGMILKKVHRVIEFTQEVWLKPYKDMKSELSKLTKNDFEKDFLKLMINSVFGKTMENSRKHGDIKLVTTDNRRYQFLLEPNYHTTKYFLENLLAIEINKTKVKINRPLHLGLSILEINKTLMHGFCMIILNQSIRTM